MGLLFGGGAIPQLQGHDEDMNTKETASGMSLGGLNLRVRQWSPGYLSTMPPFNGRMRDSDESSSDLDRALQCGELGLCCLGAVVEACLCFGLQSLELGSELLPRLVASRRASIRIGSS